MSDGSRAAAAEPGPETIPDECSAQLARRYDRLWAARYAAACCFLLAAVLGLLGMVGHLSRHWLLGSFHEGFKIMVPAVAVALLLAGVGGLLLARRGTALAVQVLAVLVMALGVLRLIEAAVGARWDSSNLFLPPSIMPLSPEETPAAPLTAVALLLLGACLLLVARRTHPTLSRYLAGAAVVIAGAYLLAFAYGSVRVLGLALVPIALPAAIAIALLGGGFTLILAGRDVARARLARDREERAQEELRQQAALLDLAPVLARDAEDHVVYWGRGMQEMYGYTPEYALGKVVHDLLLTRHPEPLAAIREKLERDGWWQGELIHARSDGCCLSVISRQMVHRDAQGRLWRIVEVNTDLTELKRVQEELQAYRDHLEEIVSSRTAKLVDSQQRLHALAADLASAEQRERQRIAEIIHDDVIQILGGMKIHLELLRASLGEARQAGSVRDVVAMVDQAVARCRDLIADISPRVLAESGVGAAVRWWAGQVKDRWGLTVHVITNREPPRLPAEVEAVLFRSVKELIQNVIKHAQAHEAIVEINCSEVSIELGVRDDGVGFDSGAAGSQEGGFGLFSIRERVEHLGGSLEITSSPGQGTSATIGVPVACDLPDASPPPAIGEAVGSGG